MTVIQPNSVAGINSITVQSGNSLAVHKANGELIRTITSNSGVSTFSSISVGTAATTNSAGKSINIGLGASISQHNANTLSLGTGGDERVLLNANGFLGIGTATVSAPLHVYSATNNTIARLDSGDATCRLQLKDSAGEGFVAVSGDDLILSNTSSITERLRITSTGDINVSTAATIKANGNATFSGIVTATSFKGDGSGLSGITGTTINGNAANRLIAGSDTANTLSGQANLTFGSDLLNISSTTQGLGLRLTNTGNEYTNIQFSAARTGANQALGIINAKWNNNHEVAAIYITAGDDTTNKDDGKIRFYTSASGGSISERLQINSAGELLIAQFSTASPGAGNNTAGFAFQSMRFYGSGTGHAPLSMNRSNDGIVALWYRGGNLVGNITVGSNSVQYNSTSDYRLKENVSSISDGITRLKTLKPSRFNFISEPSKTIDGFLAHEITAVPEAISGTKDEIALEDNEDLDIKKGNPIYQSIDQSKLVPLLTAALQEAITKIETLETKVAALEGG